MKVFKSVRWLVLSLNLLAPLLPSLLQAMPLQQGQEEAKGNQGDLSEAEIRALIEGFRLDPIPTTGEPKALITLRLQGIRAVPALLHTLRRETGPPNTAMRFSVMRVLEDIFALSKNRSEIEKDQRLYEEVLSTLKHVMLYDHNEWIRNIAVVSLAYFEDPKTVDAFLKALNDPDPLVGDSAAWALGKLKAWNAVDALIDRLQRHLSPGVAWALGEMPDPRSVPALLYALLYGPRDPLHSLRREAARALVRIGDPRAEEAFLEVLSDEEARRDEAIWGSRDPEVRVWAMRGLARLRSARAIKPIMDLLANEANSSLERQEAAWTLAELGAREA
ncbi:MAG: HEAT repeat domain-containing protein, partial [Fimbriimonadales bacterium]|nr:HEAT repeat domain-containing protein [Fimbriimonadales bacterium]